MAQTLPAFFHKEVLDKSREKPVVVDFWAPWCGPCRILGPTLERMAKTSKGRWRLVKVNSDRNPVLSQEFNIRGIPAVILFKNGEVVDQFVGVRPEHEIRAWLQPHLESKTQGDT